MRVIVCGGREYGELLGGSTLEEEQADMARAREERDALYDELDRHGITALCTGGATGADRHAHMWAEHHGLVPKTFVAQWGLHGRAAGPIRNQQMLEEFKPDAVVCFPGGRGTDDMRRRAINAGVRVIEVGS